MAKNSNQFAFLTPIGAIQKWLNGEFTIGDEPALIAAIKQDRIRLDDQTIENIILDAMDDELSADECLERLLNA